MENTHNQHTAQEYTIVRLNNDNLAHLEQLSEAVYGRKARPGFYNRKYDTAYTGVSCVGYIAYSRQHEPIAYYGVIPCFIEYAGQSVLAAQSADTMTHPGHRYKGMFAELSRLTFALCRETGIRLVFGFPNEHSYPGAIRMGWKETETLDRFDIQIASFPLASLAARWPFVKALYHGYQRKVIARYVSPQAGVRNSVLTGDASGVQRSDRYLEYKRYSDTQVLQIGRAKLWVKFTAILIIGDMEQVDEDNLDGVMQSLKRICRRLGIRSLSFHVSPHTHLHRLWSARYTAIRSFPVLFQDFGAGLPLERVKFTLADIDIF
jgi:hypothetical protein